MKILFSILLAVLHVYPSGSVQQAVDSARTLYAATGEHTTILIEPGSYYESLTLDVPGLTLCNAASQPSIGVRDGGVGIDDSAVRLSYHHGHGYQYRTMHGQFNYGGSRTRLWNASVLVDAPDVTLDGIILENSFNLYISPLEVADTLLPMTRAVDSLALAKWGLKQEFAWTEKERPKRDMPERPRELLSTLVQQKRFRERASAISFTHRATNCVLRHCRVCGRQDAFYGDHGASVLVENSILAGAVDYIFGGLELTVRHCELVAMLNTDKGDCCYIAAGRGAVCDGVGQTDAASDTLCQLVPEGEFAEQGMLFEDCLVRYATADELCAPVAPGHPACTPIWLARPWRWWGKHVFRRITAAQGVLQANPVSLGLTKGHPCPYVWIEL